MAKKDKELELRAIAVGLDKTATEEEIIAAEAAKAAEATNNVEETVEEVEETVESESTLSSDEFMNRLMAATEKHIPVKPGIDTEEDAERLKGEVIRKMGRRISHLCPQNTLEVVKLVESMYAGKYQNDKMLVLIEEMPENGYGHE